MLTALLMLLACHGDKAIVDTAQEDVDGDGFAPAEGSTNADVLLETTPTFTEG